MLQSPPTTRANPPSSTSNPYPISYKGQYHYRSGSTKQELKRAALDKFLLRKQGKHWDGVLGADVAA